MHCPVNIEPDTITFEKINYIVFSENCELFPAGTHSIVGSGKDFDKVLESGKSRLKKSPAEKLYMVERKTTHTVIERFY